MNFSTTTLSYPEKSEYGWIRPVRGGYNKTYRTWYRDDDRDGYGDETFVIILNSTSPEPSNYVLNKQDCDDTDALINPLASEIPDDGIDQNCNDLFQKTWYEDKDSDSFGSQTSYILSESQPDGFIRNQSDIDNNRFDCNDDNKSINPNMTEIPNDGIDNDCNGKQSLSWYVDSDGDGYGDGLMVSTSENPPEDAIYATNDIDCNDTDPHIHPGLVEIIGDSIDTNCNGEINDDHLHLVQDTGQTTSHTSIDGEDSDFLINRKSFTKIDSDGSPIPLSSSEWFVVRDNVTDLFWEVKTVTNANTLYTFDQATAYAANLELAGYTDWRLPTATELATIANLELSSPAYDVNFFPNTPDGRLWSSTDCGSDSNSLAVRTRYSEASMQNKTTSFYVRAVRDGNDSEIPLVDNGDGTFSENLSGLMWANSVFSSDTWQNSVDLWNTETFSGYSDWRLPSESDILSLLNLINNSDINIGDYFTEDDVNGFFWTCTLDPLDAGQATTYSILGRYLGSSILSSTLQGIGVRGTRQGRFIDNGDGTIFDNKTGLMWLKSNGNNNDRTTFTGALYYCNELIHAGYEDWRLPSRNELLSLLEASLDKDSGYELFFSDTGSFYWTSSSSCDVPDNAWQLNFTSGEIEISLGSYINENLFRAVRGGNIE